MCEFKQQVWSLDIIPKDILIDKNKRLEQNLKVIKELAEEYISTCDFSWKCKECFDGCWAREIMKICEVENDKAD